MWGAPKASLPWRERGEEGVEETENGGEKKKEKQRARETKSEREREQKNVEGLFL